MMTMLLSELIGHHAHGDPTTTSKIGCFKKETTDKLVLLINHTHTHTHLSAMALLICCLVASFSLCSWYSNCSISCTSWQPIGRGHAGKELKERRKTHTSHHVLPSQQKSNSSGAAAAACSTTHQAPSVVTTSVHKMARCSRADTSQRRWCEISPL